MKITTSWLKDHLNTKLNENQIIVIEDLNVSGMMKNHKLSKHIADASWGNFVTLLQYKCDWYGKNFIQIEGLANLLSNLCNQSFAIALLSQ